MAVTCRKCGTDDPGLLYRSGKQPWCYDCRNYANLVGKKTGGTVHFTLEEFLTWKRSQPRRCHYCGITDGELFQLGIRNSRSGRVTESIGVDRVDNSVAYRIGNLVLCCAACNSIKGSILTCAEMETLGPQLAGFWRERLRARHSEEVDVPPGTE
jgi:hypothetical protein